MTERQRRGLQTLRTDNQRWIAKLRENIATTRNADRQRHLADKLRAAVEADEVLDELLGPTS